jgi:hypothetical protein
MTFPPIHPHPLQYVLYDNNDAYKYRYVFQ